MIEQAVTTRVLQLMWVQISRLNTAVSLMQKTDATDIGFAMAAKDRECTVVPLQGTYMTSRAVQEKPSASCR